MANNLSPTRYYAARVTALVVLVVLVQLLVAARYHRHFPTGVSWRSALRYIVEDDQLFFRNIRFVLYQPKNRQTFAPVESPVPATFIPDAGIGWENLSKGRWIWRGTFVGSYPPPTKPTAAGGTWVSRSKGWTLDPRDSRKWRFGGSFNGPSPPSPPEIGRASCRERV